LDCVYCLLFSFGDDDAITEAAQVLMPIFLLFADSPAVGSLELDPQPQGRNMEVRHAARNALRFESGALAGSTVATVGDRVNAHAWVRLAQPLNELALLFVLGLQNGTSSFQSGHALGVSAKSSGGFSS
jgi:hypothetical protein